MRKTIAVLISICLTVMVFAGCTSKPDPFTAEDFVTMEQLNTEGRYVARGYLESLFLNNRAMFNSCFPEGYVEDLEKVAGGDVFEQFTATTAIGGDFLGAATTDHRDVTINNGYDVATFRSQICRVANCEYSDIGNIQIQKVQVLYMNSKAKMMPKGIAPKMSHGR